MKKHFSFLCFWLLASHLFAQTNNLKVSDVRNSWYSYQGTIEEATLSVRPQGLYMECGLYLTFSARGVNFGTFGDSIEVVLNFTLPDGSIVHDSWLWVGEDIVKARILDAWSATNIYEGIVKRRQDPSLLTKQSPNQYQLRVFPMVKTGTRRVKITWLQPASLSQNWSDITLPFHILNTSKNTVQNFNLLVWPDDRFKNPTLPDYPQAIFEAVSDSLVGLFHHTKLPPAAYAKNPYLQMTSPLKNGYYLSTRTEGEEGIYQLAVLPKQFIPQKRQRKLAVLLDYEKRTNSMSSSALLTNAKNALLNELEQTDSFNLFFSNLIIGKVSSLWLPAHPDTIQKVFQQLASPLSDYSNLQSLLVAGIQWAQQNGPDGNILLVSNSSHLSTFQVANPLLNDLTALNHHPIVPVHVVDFNQDYTPKVTVGNTAFYANGYFLYNLAGLNEGTYQKTLGTQPLDAALKQTFSNFDRIAQSFDLHTSLEDGFCYGRFNLSNNTGNVVMDKPLLQIGKFKGNGPFRLEMNGVLDGEIFQSKVKPPVSEILPADTLIREMWYGQYIKTLESEGQTTNTISDIVFKSLSERVLSKYTAFLCLENPEWICEDCEDETQYTSTDDLAPRDSMLVAFPNPFSEQVTIVVQMPSGKTMGQSSLEIFGTDGRLIRLFDLNLQSGSSQTRWDGTDASGRPIPRGAYICMLRANGQTRAMRLMKL